MMSNKILTTAEFQLVINKKLLEMMDDLDAFNNEIFWVLASFMTTHFARG